MILIGQVNNLLQCISRAPEATYTYLHKNTEKCSKHSATTNCQRLLFNLFIITIKYTHMHVYNNGITSVHVYCL